MHCSREIIQNTVRGTRQAIPALSYIAVAVLSPQAGLAGQPIKYNMDLIDNAGHGVHMQMVDWWAGGVMATMY